MLADGDLICVDAATGKEKWNLELDGEFWASPVLAKDRVYAITRKGVLFVVSTAGKKLDEVQLDAGRASHAGDCRGTHLHSHRRRPAVLGPPVRPHAEEVFIVIYRNVYANLHRQSRRPTDPS